MRRQRLARPCHSIAMQTIFCCQTTSFVISQRKGATPPFDKHSSRNYQNRLLRVYHTIYWVYLNIIYFYDGLVVRIKTYQSMPGMDMVKRMGTSNGPHTVAGPALFKRGLYLN